MHIIAGETPGWQHADVWLDGERVGLCVEANEEEGWVKCLRVEPGTLRAFVCDAHGEPIVETRHGKVEVRWRRDYHAKYLALH